MSIKSNLPDVDATVGNIAEAPLKLSPLIKLYNKMDLKKMDLNVLFHNNTFGLLAHESIPSSSLIRLSFWVPEDSGGSAH